jgi:hypothetical protein
LWRTAGPAGSSQIRIIHLPVCLEGAPVSPPTLIEEVIRGLDLTAASLHQLACAEPLQIGVAAGALIIGRGIDLRPFHRMRIVADQEFKNPAFALGQALKHIFAQR